MKFNERRLKAMLLPVITVAATLLGAARAEAVAFKCHNQTNQTFRFRVHDRGAWRKWETMQPGYWACPGPMVKRTKHRIQIDVETTKDGKKQWVPFYRGTHGSKVFTRIIHLYNKKAEEISMEWYDEPPSVRDKPVWTGNKVSKGKLLKSGWLKRELKKVAGTTLKLVVETETAAAKILK